jgi:hypothetical protein
LHGAVLSDRGQREKAATIFVVRTAHEPAVDHHADAWDRQRSLGDVGGEHDLATWLWVERAPLFVERKSTV